MTAVSMFAPKERWEPRIKKLFEEGLGERLMFWFRLCWND